MEPLSGIRVGPSRVEGTLSPISTSSRSGVEGVRAAVAEAFEVLSLPESPERAVGVAGSLTSLAAIDPDHMTVSEHDLLDGLVIAAIRSSA